jgi:hypothetical protein
MIECNVLGSGSRRHLYTPNNLTTIGCNIPYADVTYIAVHDFQILSKIENILNPHIKLIVRDKLYSRILKEYPELVQFVGNIFAYYEIDSNRYIVNSGHYATMYMIKLGYTKLNLYGMDSWFNENEWANSYTDQFISKPNGMNNNMGSCWKRQWELMIKQYPKVEFNFI